MGRPARIAVLVTAAATAAALAGPAAAQDDAADGPAWPMPNADVGATNQSPTAGPEDPGLKWHLDLNDVETDAAPEGYDSMSEDILLSESGVLVARVSNPDERYEPTARFRSELIGIDLDTAEVLWEIPNVSPVSSGSCHPALDSQDRIWVEQRPDAGDRVVRAFDPETGEHLGPEIEAEDQRCREQVILGGEQERLVFSTSNAQNLRMFDIAGDDATEIDVDLAGRDDAGDLLNHGNRDHWAVMTSDHLVTLVEIVDDEGDEIEHRIVSIDLADGTTTDEITLPTVDGVGSTEIDRAYLLAHDDRVYLSTRKTGDSQILAVDAAGGQLSLDWEWDLDVRTEDLTLGDGVVMFQDGRRVAGAAPSVTALDLDDGSLVFDNGESVGDHPLANPDGSFYGRTTDGGTRLNEISLMNADGQLQWRIERERIVQEVDGADEIEDLGMGNMASTNMSAIGADGTLYVTNDEAILAIDDSGGLTEFTCAEAFEDVDANSTHACNIDEMAARGITEGVAPGLFDPDGTVPRQQFASFLVRALDDVDPTDSGPFDDVNPDSVHAPNIFGAAAAGITQGTSETTFAPRVEINRAQVASLLARAFDLDPVDDGPFDDVDSGNVHAGNINAVFEAGITQGVTETSFDPERTLNRAQMSSLLIRALDAAED